MDEEERTVGIVNIEARYVPCPVVLEPRESINSMFIFLGHVLLLLLLTTAPDQGLLRVNLFSGHDIRAVDRGGMMPILHSEMWVIKLTSNYRQIGSVRCFHAQWTEGVQIPDEEEDAQPGLERGLHRLCGALKTPFVSHYSLIVITSAISGGCRLRGRDLRLESARAGQVARLRQDQP